MYFTSGSDRAFEQLMQTRPGADHFDSGEAGAPEDCGTCRFYRPHWKYQFCVYEECPYQPGKAHHGQQSLRQLKKDGSALSNIEITDANIGLFKPCAKKYDIDFTLRKDRTTHPPRYIVIFKSKQADNLEQAFKEFTAKKLKQQERPSIRKTLAVLKEKAAARSSQQAKEKIKERGLSR